MHWMGLNISAYLWFQELSSDGSRADKILHSHYLISVLLPVLKEINQERSIELEVEAKLRGLNFTCNWNFLSDMMLLPSK